MNSQTTFEPLYWGDDQSTEVRFEPTSVKPSDELVSSCFVFAIHDNKLVMSKPKRGWGLPGGRREKDETAEACVRREADEEAGITLGDLTLIGQWVAKKRFDSDFNRQYPALAYQLLYTADVTAAHGFTATFESSERAFVPLQEVEKLHHNFANFKTIFEFVVKAKGLNL